jgi:hypothetical protein
MSNSGANTSNTRNTRNTRNTVAMEDWYSLYPSHFVSLMLSVTIRLLEDLQGISPRTIGDQV